MNIVTLIPARGGSKGIKKKNIIKINNKPLIFYSIDISKKIKSINETFVSSDSNQILKISKKFEAKTIKRPKKISVDKSTDLEAFKHFYIEYKKKYKKEIDLLVHLRPTTPFRKEKTIKKIINIMKINKKFSSLRCFIKSTHSPFKMYTQKNKTAKPPTIMVAYFNAFCFSSFSSLLFSKCTNPKTPKTGIHNSSKTCIEVTALNLL